MQSDIRDEYFMCDAREFYRLASKVEPGCFFNHYLSEYIDSQQQYCILDVGAGAFVIAKHIANLLPESKVYAIDSDYLKVTKALENAPKNIEIQHASAYKIPHANNLFDMVFARFLFEYLEEPQKVLQEMIRVCKPGGKVMVQDLDGQIINHYPEDEVLQAETKAIIEYLSEQGFDIHAGRKLYNFAYNNGLKNIKTTLEPYHFFAGKIDDKNYMLWDLKLDIALPQVAKALGSMEKAKDYKKRYLEHLLREDVFSFSTVITVTGSKY